ncbi:MAG: aldehyde dehydrogenase [Verrucomicrobiales bacterium]|nr:aldehyde dehydrogenase [Verrucomicrobiales bacterium]
MSELPELPLLRHGVPYTSLDVSEIQGVSTGEPVLRVSQANSGLVARELTNTKAARAELQKIPMRQRMEMVKKAGEIFLNDTLPLGTDGRMQSPEDYVKQLSSTGGLPHRLIRMNMQRLAAVFGQIDIILRGLTRGLDPDVLDRGYGEQGGAPVSFGCVTDHLAVILPSNSPAVNALWIPAIAMGVPVILKPGREEPWTPWRIIEAMIKAGFPRSAFSFLPCGHDGSALIVRRAGRVMMFGDDATVAQHASDPRVEVHGSGRSKILIGEDKIEQWRDFLPVLVESVSANSGRSCINTSAILVPKYAAEIGQAMAEALKDMLPRASEDPEATLSGFANPAMPEWIDGTITDGMQAKGAVDHSAALRGNTPRRAAHQGMNYLLPTIVGCPDFDHPLANREFLFPFASVTEVPQAQMLDVIGPSLVVTAITEDQSWIPLLLECPHIDRLNLGPTPTNRVQWDQPHEGNLFEFLFRRRSIGVPAVAA